MLNKETYACHLEFQTFELRVPVAVLQQDLWEKLQSEREKKDVIYHLRTSALTTIPIPSGVTSFMTSNIFSNGMTPAKVCFAFVKTGDLEGKMDRNPLNLLRNLSATCWINKCELLLNEQSLDGLATPMTKHDCMGDYYRFYQCLNMQNTVFTNSVTYDMFKGGYYVKIYDLSCSNDSNTPYVVSCVRDGHFRFNFGTNTATPFELTACVLSYYDQTMIINKSNHISLSYQT